MATPGDKIAVLGAGSWGTALAIELAARHPVVLWGHTPEAVAAMQQDRENRHYLPGVPFPGRLQVTVDLGQAIDAASEVLVVVPSHAFASVCAQLAELSRTLERLSGTDAPIEPT